MGARVSGLKDSNEEEEDASLGGCRIWGFGFHRAVLKISETWKVLSVGPEHCGVTTAMKDIRTRDRANMMRMKFSCGSQTAVIH